MSSTDHFDRLPESIKKSICEKNGAGDGLPEHLKKGVESLSGISMDDVRVHYNSLSPPQIGAQSYSSGNDIYIGPGQEKHLPHEAWHVVQQKQGRVKPTINGAPDLAVEADVMGAKALVLGTTQR
jgi:hypothetical protein